jgi:hypothetical protein
VFADFPGRALISAIIGVNTRRFHHGQFDVGVIPATATGCSKPEDAVAIEIDNEDDDNINNAGGWVGGTSNNNSSTTFRFCRVDGSKFRPLAGAANARERDLRNAGRAHGLHGSHALKPLLEHERLPALRAEEPTHPFETLDLLGVVVWPISCATSASCSKAVPWKVKLGDWLATS